VTYQLRFWLSDHAHFNPARSHIRTNLWYALRRHNISIPFPIQHELSLPQPKPHTEDRALIRASIEKTIIASFLSPAQLGQIVEAARIVRFGKGENIIRREADAGPMYVLVSGNAEVWIEAGGVMKSAAVLGPDACIGENSVLTGERRSATVVALEDCLAVEVDKSTLSPIISASPDLLESLSELLARRKMQNEGIVAEAAENAVEANRSYKEGFLEKLKMFFEV
jgi:CRP-like cAMP-binding protein